MGPEASDDGYEDWLQRHFPEHTGRPLAEHHHEFWRWVWGISAQVASRTGGLLLRPDDDVGNSVAGNGIAAAAGDVRSVGEGLADLHGPEDRGRGGSRPFVAIWPRGGAKSTSAELAVVACAARQTRRYCLYVSGTQDQANDHVLSIRNMFESREFGAAYAQAADRRLGKYGQSQGWQQKRIRTQDGFAVDAIGLDKSVRGLKDESRRPDLIILDDIDALGDSELTTDKKIQAITRDILFTDATEGAAVLAIQNLILPRGVFAKLAEEPPLFLKGRTLSGPVPAVRDLVLDGDRIVSGVPTWKSLEACQADIDGKTLDAWLAECQHEVGLRQMVGLVLGKDDDGELIFDPLRNVAPAPCRWEDCAWRIAAIDPGGDGDPTVIGFLGVTGQAVGPIPSGALRDIDLRRVHVYDTVTLHGAADVFTWVQAMKPWHDRAKLSVVTVGETGGATHVATLKRMNLPAMKAEMARAHIKTLQRRLKAGLLTIDPACVSQFMFEAQSWWWKKDREPGRTAISYETVTGPGHHADTWDMTRYGNTALLVLLPGIPTPAGQVGRANGPQFIRPGQGGFVSAGVRR